ncbi:hypothetical protein REDROCK_44 [Mycobacterium phage RedRock]|uniref:Uncharacterized protein n=1 Tax=Mycobacterium phage RedRock TaxID=711470 RepID=D3JZA6_9CAUD|nr:hypothetical protein REDROCK_44 [Mycobacterium phage RedRock]YP_009303497.1 hypothetical protein SEA_LOSER_44 [Mycobacterium phage Loser]ADB93737.1 hypothetical protein REDROCK_44 [Mycobacterium phage RedRock]AMS00940.1 hypothetical protein SEA_LOSER_44 [Mycobacterium phage Loser]
MPEAKKAAMLQPATQEAIDIVGITALIEQARHAFERLGEVVGEVTSKVFERAEIDGLKMPWGYEIDGEWIELPEDYHMIRYEAFVIPKEGTWPASV